MHPDGRTKEQVGLAFWPEASTSQLRNNFHVTLHRLRRALGGTDWILLTGDRYRVDPASRSRLDVSAFERDVTDASRSVKRQEERSVATLDEVLRHYRGDLLDGEPVTTGTSSTATACSASTSTR